MDKVRKHCDETPVPMLVFVLQARKCEMMVSNVEAVPCLEPLQGSVKERVDAAK